MTLTAPLLAPGRYRMEWAGYAQEVRVSLRARADGSWEAFFTNPAGWAHPVATVPDATFTRIDPQ